jgi:hypothetical protein
MASAGQPRLAGRATLAKQTLSDLMQDGFVAIAREHALGTIRIGPFRQTRGARKQQGPQIIGVAVRGGQMHPMPRVEVNPVGSARHLIDNDVVAGRITMAECPSVSVRFANRNGMQLMECGGRQPQRLEFRVKRRSPQ